MARMPHTHCVGSCLARFHASTAARRSNLRASVRNRMPVILVPCGFAFSRSSCGQCTWQGLGRKVGLDGMVERRGAAYTSRPGCTGPVGVQGPRCCAAHRFLLDAEALPQPHGGPLRALGAHATAAAWRVSTSSGMPGMLASRIQACAPRRHTRRAAPEGGICPAPARARCAALGSIRGPPGAPAHQRWRCCPCGLARLRATGLTRLPCRVVGACSAVARVLQGSVLDVYT